MTVGEDVPARKPGLIRRAADTVRRFLSDGMSPEKVALAVALGATCGLFPVFGATTAVAAAAGVLFRANPVVVQIFNYAMYPVYFFVEFGLIATAAWIFEGDLHAYTPEGLRALFNAGWGAMLSQGGRALGQAVVLWLTLAPFTVLALRWLTLRIIDKWPARPRA